MTAGIGALVFVGAALLSWLAVGLLLRTATRHLLDQPNDRSMHSVPTPRGGGLPVSVIAACVFMLAPESSALGVRALQAVLVGVVAAVGFLDDLKNLSWRVRFGVHLVVAIAALAMWGPFDAVLVFGVELPLGVAGIALTLVWIVGLVNAYNFMDGIDGIAGGQAVGAAGIWAVAAALAGQWHFAWALFGLAGAATGFLFWNGSPARIFMGDVGSTALGYAFAVIPMVARRAEIVSDGRAAWLAIGAVLPFVYDAASTFARRAIRRENVLAAHRTHTYQLLAGRIGHRPVAHLWFALAGLSGGSALAFATGAQEIVAWVGFVLVAVAIEVARKWAESPTAK